MSKPTTLLFIFSLALIITALLIGSFWRQPPTPQSPDKLHILTTFFPLYDFTRQIGGQHIVVDLLFTQTPEVSSFTPEDIQKINQAEILIKNGAGLEPVLDELIASGDNSNLTIIDTSQGVPLRQADPHIWLDPNHAIIQVQNIANALAAADPDHASDFQANAQAYITQLKQLDTDIKQRVATFTHRDFVAFHPAFSYFATRYHLNQAAVIEEFPGQEPSPQYLAQIINTIRDLKISAIFSEPQFSPRVIQSIARDTGLTVYTLDPIETGDPARDSYLSLMRQNLTSITKALQ